MGCFSSSTKDDDQSIIVQSAKKLKVVVIGLEKAGKTSILQYLKNGHFAETQPTIGLNVENISYKQRNYLVFDVGGKVRSLWSHYYENLDALVFVVDSTDKLKLQSVKEELIRLNKEVAQQQVVVLVYFSKIDLPSTLDMKLLLQETNISEQESDIIIQRCSARTGVGIWDGIDKMNSLMDQKFKT